MIVFLDNSVLLFYHVLTEKKRILNGCINRIIYYLLQPQIATSQLRGTAQNKHISIYRSLVSYFKWSDESVGFLRLNLHASTCHSHLHSPGTQSAHVLKQHFPADVSLLKHVNTRTYNNITV